MSLVSKIDKNVEGDCESTSSSPQTGGHGFSGHKASFRSTKLARRARSFKEDILEKFSQIRSPGGTPGLRSQSPKSRPNVNKQEPILSVDKNNTKELDIQLHQIQLALKHFRDVISKLKIEILPGNGTVVLEIVTSIHTALKHLVDGSTENQSTVLSSATHQVYQSLASFLKLCDETLMYGEKSPSLDMKNVSEVITFFENSIKNLVKLSQEKLNNQETTTTVTPKPRKYSAAQLDIPGQRNSLPDIPLTPKERQILEQQAIVRNSHSSESILRDTSPPPPPKPPLPESICLSTPDSIPPPIPPKKRGLRSHLLDDSFDVGLLGCSFDRISLRSRSPEDSNSLLSTSSLDSVLMQSRDEEEMKALIDHTKNDDIILQSDISDLINYPFDNNRLSATSESGFGSLRSSVQSYSTRSSQQSSNSTSKWFNKSVQQQKTERTKIVQKSDQIVEESSVIKREVSVQSFSSKTLTSSSTITNINELSSQDMEFDAVEPPELPVKRRMKVISKENRPSQYDNVQTELAEHIVTCALHQSQNTTMSSISSKTDKSNSTSPEHDPPPLPPKKKHIMAYMEMFGNCSHTAVNNGDFLRHSMHTYNVMQSEWRSQDDVADNIDIINQSIQQTTTLASTQSCSFNYDNTPVIQRLNTSQLVHGNRRPMTCSPAINSPETKPLTPPALPPKKLKKQQTPPHSPQPQSTSPPLPIVTVPVNDDKAIVEVVNDNNNYEENDLDLLELLDVTDHLIYKKPDEDGPDLRGGHPDALIVHATKSNKNATDEKHKDFKYQEAFLTTYRTFLTPDELIWKLQDRHRRFRCHSNVLKQRAAKESFSLLVSVVNDLTFPVQIVIDEDDGKKYPEFTSQSDKKLLQTLMEFEYQLVCSGDLIMAKALRVKILERFAISQLHAIPPNKYLTNICTAASTLQLLDFKSEQIAEQMTLLDADLFMRIEISEILIWAQEQKEDLSPNLTRFTEHFNKMSYWARSRILEQNDAKERERYVVKFIKIMKYLRKMNNFNSYLALLSALDSAPIRRLEWQKQITEGLKEYCALIDSSSSFRAYRQALSETQPPCIPYIGLILQDLTFVNIGNSDLLSDGNINFSKRWQQFNILDNMKRFKKGMYSFKKHDRLISFLNDFEPCMSEEEMWQISETIKPRGGRKPPS